jgi:CxxC motif-containing protein
MILAAVLCPIGVYVDNANIYFVCGKSCPKEVYGIQAVIFPGLATVVLLILGGES